MDETPSDSSDDPRELAKALGELEKRHRLVVEHAREGFWIIDEDAKTTFVNTRMAEMLGYTRDEMMGMPLHAFMDEKGKRLSERNLERRRQGIEEQHDFEFMRKDGCRIYTSLETAPILDESGTYTGAMAFVFDVTKQREVRHEVRNLAAIVESIGDAVVSARLDGRILSWNRGAERLFGYSEEEALSMTFPDLSPPAVRAEGRELVQRVVAGEHVVVHDTVRMTKAGLEVPVSITLSPLFAGGDMPIGIAAVVRDISERLQAQRSLKAANRLLTSIIESAGEGIFVKDAELRYQLINRRAARMMGLEPEAIIGKTDDDLAAPWVTSSTRALDAKVLRERRGHSEERTFVGPDETDHWVVETKTPLFDAENVAEVSGIVGVVRDVTAQRQAAEERQALEAQMLKVQKLESLGLLAGGIAHDFNNLLVAILGNADLAAMELPKASPVQEDLAAIITASRRASELCRQLLAYAGRGRFVIKRMELSGAVQEISALLGLSLSKQAILQLDLAESPVLVEVDVTQLRQVIMNLITNASEAIGDDRGVIRVTTGAARVDRAYLESCVGVPEIAEGTYAYVEVSDTGVGMSRDTIDKIFDPFFTSKFTGRGLGLAAVLGIVRGHDGAIRVYSEPGEGSSFKVLLPVVGAAAEATCDDAPALLETGKGAVLVIDDDSSVLHFASRALKRAGYEPITAGSGEEGVERYRAEGTRVVAVLLDMTMPGMDGRATFSELRKLDAGVRVVLSSGFNEQETTSKLAGRGLAGFLPKPYSVQDLMACLREALDES
jgi:PAS domain S-box-containing protein